MSSNSKSAHSSKGIQVKLVSTSWYFCEASVAVSVVWNSASLCAVRSGNAGTHTRTEPPHFNTANSSGAGANQTIFKILYASGYLRLSLTSVLKSH